MLGRRGVDSWDAIKWIPRISLFAISLVLVLYIFATITTVSYDPNVLTAESFAPMIMTSNAFVDPTYLGRIDLSRFTSTNLDRTFPWKDPNDPKNAQSAVSELVFAPVSARLTLSSPDSSFSTKITYYQKRTFDALDQLYVSSAHSSVVFSKDTEIVKVIDPNAPEKAMPGLLTIEVLVP